MGDNAGVYRAVPADNPKAASEPIFTPHIRAYREIIDTPQIGGIRWCDNRDTITDPLTNGETRSKNLNIMMDQGKWHHAKLHNAVASDGCHGELWQRTKTRQLPTRSSLHMNHYHLFPNM